MLPYCCQTSPKAISGFCAQNKNEGDRKGLAAGCPRARPAMWASVRGIHYVGYQSRAFKTQKPEQPGDSVRFIFEGKEPVQVYRRRTFGCTTPCFAAELPWRYSISSSLHHGQKTIRVGICITIDPLRCRLQRELENLFTQSYQPCCSPDIWAPQPALSLSSLQLCHVLVFPTAVGHELFMWDRKPGLPWRAFHCARSQQLLAHALAGIQPLGAPHLSSLTLSVSLWFSLVAHNADVTRKNPFCSASQRSSWWWTGAAWHSEKGVSVIGWCPFPASARAFHGHLVPSIQAGSTSLCPCPSVMGALQAQGTSWFPANSGTNTLFTSKQPTTETRHQTNQQVMTAGSCQPPERNRV